MVTGLMWVAKQKTCWGGSIGGVVVSLTSLVARLQHIETHQFRPRLAADAAVAKALKASLNAEQVLYLSLIHI